MNILDYEFDEKLLEQSNTDVNEKLIPARIITTYRDRYEIICNNGKGFAKLKSGSYYDNPDSIFPTIGDFVLIEWNNTGDSMITQTLKRKSCFSRFDPSPDRKHEQFVAANFDYVFIIQSLNNNYNLRRIERYLTIAWQSGGIPVIILTKCDLIEDYLQIVSEIEDIAPLVDIHVISSKTGQGIDELQKYFKPKKSVVFLGSSGVGKSTLVNRLAGNEIMETKEIREDDSRGRHTTTHRQLIMLESGTMIIDTPGMRELGMWDVSEGLDKTFKDIDDLLGNCKFSNCTHTNEPGCAILEAIQDGQISEDRFNSYIKLRNEAKYIEDSQSYLREKKQKFKEITKQNRNNFKK